MIDDRLMADFLGEAPRAPDPGFRFAVFARITEHARRRAGLRRALRTIGLFACVGLVFPLAAAAGLEFADVQPLVMVASVLAAAYLLALLAIEGPGGVLARSGALARGT